MEVTPMKIDNCEHLEQTRSEVRARAAAVQRQVLICGGTGCLANGSADIYEAFRAEAARRGLDLDVQLRVTKTGCHGFCERGPLVIILPEDIFYQRVAVKDVVPILEQTVATGEIIQRLLYRDPNTRDAKPHTNDIGFYNMQQRLVLRNIGKIDPADIDDAIAHGAYAGLAKALTHMTPDHVIAEVTNANLRGRGGGGFPAGRKWRSCVNAHGLPRYVICNGDEGDPGAFMDRSIMEGDPHSVIEASSSADMPSAATKVTSTSAKNIHWL